MSKRKDKTKTKAKKKTKRERPPPKAGGTRARKEALLEEAICRLIRAL